MHTRNICVLLLSLGEMSRERRRTHEHKNHLNHENMCSCMAFEQFAVMLHGNSYFLHLAMWSCCCRCCHRCSWFFCCSEASERSASTLCIVCTFSTDFVLSSFQFAMRACVRASVCAWILWLVFWISSHLLYVKLFSFHLLTCFVFSLRQATQLIITLSDIHFYFVRSFVCLPFLF